MSVRPSRQPVSPTGPNTAATETSPNADEDPREVRALLADFQDALHVLQQLATELEDRVQLLNPSLTARVVSFDDERAPRVGIATLGTFAVTIDGRALSLPRSGIPTSILKLLAHHGGKPTSRELLVESLWPGVAIDVGANRLRVAVHSLRQVDPELHLLVGSVQGSYAFLGARAEVDADRFERLLASGRSLEVNGDPDSALTVYREAEALYQGDYFADDLYQDWAQLRRQHLRDLYLNLLVRLALSSLERGDYEGCIAHCHEIVSQDSCSEEAYRLLMLAHARRGNRARALRWYSLCEQALRRDLAIEPSPVTVAIRDQILSGSASDSREIRAQLGLD